MPKSLTKSIRVLVVDDHNMARLGISVMLSTVDDIEVVGEAGDGLEAIALVETCAPTVILMDLLMPEMDGPEAIRRILATRPAMRIILMTGSEVEDEIFEGIEAGARGFLPKTSSEEELISAIRQVAAGQSCLPPELTRRLVARLKARPAPKEALTSRESEVLHLLSKGHSNRQIAAELGVADITVRTHVSRILAKLQVKNRVEAALFVLRNGQ